MTYSHNTMIDRNTNPDGDIDVVTLDEYLDTLTRVHGISTPTAETITPETLQEVLSVYGGEIVDVTYIETPKNVEALGVMVGRHCRIVEGKYVSEPDIRPYTDAERVDVMNGAIRNLRSMTDMFVTRTLEDPVAVAVGNFTVDIQLRDSDRINLIGLLMLAKGFIAQGQDELMTMEFRTSNDETIQLKPSEMVMLTSAVLERYAAVKGYGWGIKDSLKTVTDLGDLFAIRDHFNDVASSKVDLQQLLTDVTSLLQ